MVQKCRLVSAMGAYVLHAFEVVRLVGADAADAEDPSCLLQTVSIPSSVPQKDGWVEVEHQWCNQSITCDALCPQQVKCPEAQCALNVESDCCAWHCVDRAQATKAWMKYTSWRTATNYSCPPPLCSSHDFMGGVELDFADARVGGGMVAPNKTKGLQLMTLHGHVTTGRDCTVTVHPVYWANEMSFELVGSGGQILCQGPHAQDRFWNGVSKSFSCSCPPEEVKVHCLDSYGDGWHGGFLEIDNHQGSPPAQFCADFRSGGSQVETLPRDPCDIPRMPTSAIDIKSYAAQAKTHGDVVVGVSHFLSGALMVAGAAATWAGPSRPVFKTLGQHLNFMGTQSDAWNRFSPGYFETFAEDGPSMQQQTAEVTQDVMQNSIDQVYQDMAQVTESLAQCVEQSVDGLRRDIAELKDSLVIEMHEQDFKTNLRTMKLRSEHGLNIVLAFLYDPDPGQEEHWLKAAVAEGLHGCMNVGLLSSQVSERNILQVVRMLAEVDEWFNACKVFGLISRFLHASKSQGPSRGSALTEVLMARKFLGLYRSTKRYAEVVSPSKMSKTVRDFELPVLNFLNLAEAEHHHAIHSLDFPHRQGGAAVPIVPHGFGAVAYTRYYATGAAEQFLETCRFCREDGEAHVHYGCWEEKALSFDRCVSSGGIYYDAPLPVSNVYECQQFQSYGGRTVSCGGRPQQ